MYIVKMWFEMALPKGTRLQSQWLVATNTSTNPIIIYNQGFRAPLLGWWIRLCLCLAWRNVDGISQLLAVW